MTSLPEQLRHERAGIYDQAQAALTACALAASILMLSWYEILLGKPGLPPQLHQALAEIPHRRLQLLRAALPLRRQIEAQQPAMQETAVSAVESALS